MMEPLAIVLSLLLVPSAPAAGSTGDSLTEARSRHYRLLYAGSQEQADELANVLEQAYAGFADLLGRAPKRKHLPLELRVYATRDGWIQGLALDQAVPTEGVDLLWFRPENDVVYMYRQGTPWLTRALAIHGAFQQFHCTARAKDRDLAHSWFVLGMAEQMSMHRWYGRRLGLGARLLVCLKDLPEQALENLDQLPGALRSPYCSDLRHPALAWALVSFLESGVDERRQGKFHKLALGRRGSKLMGHDFARSLGDADDFTRELEYWLEGVQIPWRPESGDWEDVGKSQIVARSLDGAPAVAVLRIRPERLQLRVNLEEDVTIGLVTDWQDFENHTIVEVEPTWLRISQVEDGEHVLAHDMLIKGRQPSLSLRRDADGDTWFRIGDDRELALGSGDGAWGLWVQGGSASFRELEWH